MGFDPKLNREARKLEADKLAKKFATMESRLVRVETALAKLVKLLGYAETE